MNDHNSIIVVYNEDGTVKSAKTLYVGTGGKDREQFEQICKGLPESGWIAARLSDVVISNPEELFCPKWRIEKGTHLANVGRFELSVFGDDEDGYQYDISLDGETLGVCEVYEVPDLADAKTDVVAEFNGLFVSETEG